MKRILSTTCTALLIALFTYTAISKLADYDTFRIQLRQSPFLSSLADTASLLVPAAELVFAALLCYPRTRLIGFYGSLFQMVLFTAYVYSMLNYSPYLPCSCGGVLSEMSWNTHLYFNLGFSAVAFCGVLAVDKRTSPQNS